MRTQSSDTVARILVVLVGLVGPLSLATAADVAPPLPAIGTNFTANYLGDTGSSLLIPPDTDGAVGLNHYVAFTNGTFSIWNKSNGSQVSKISDDQFWLNAGITSGIQNNISDPRIVFDPSQQRWFAAQITTGELTGNYMLVARSNDADPTHGFKATNFVISPGYFGDYTTLGVNSSAVFVGVNNFTSSGSFANTINIASIPKTDLLQATPGTANKTIFNGYSTGTYGFTPQLANDFGSSPNGRGLVISSGGAGQVKLFNVDNTTGGPGTATVTNLTGKTDLAANSPAAMHQPSGTRVVDGGDLRFSGNAYKVGDLVYAVRSFLNTGTDRDAIAWSIFRESDKTTVAQGTISDAAHDFSYPSVAANQFGQVVVGYTRSGTSAVNNDGYLAAYASTGAFDGTTINFNSPLLLKAGEGNYSLSGGGRYRWGDYSATGVDPNNPYSFWTTQEFAKANVSGYAVGWATQVTQLTFVPEPSTVALLGAAALAGTLACARRRRRG